MGERYRQVPDELMTCRGCRLTVLARGDWKGWKGIQLDPAVAELTWFCNKKACVEARDEAMEKAMRTWSGTTGEGEDDGEGEGEWSEEGAGADDASSGRI